MATFIDFAKPLEGQIGRMDEDEEFKLIRRTTDGKGWVWRALEEDETFTTAGAPPSIDALFGAFEDFVETGNPRRFTWMGESLKTAAAASKAERAAAEQAAAAERAAALQAATSGMFAPTETTGLEEATGLPITATTDPSGMFAPTETTGVTPPRVPLPNYILNMGGDRPQVDPTLSGKMGPGGTVPNQATSSTFSQEFLDKKALNDATWRAKDWLAAEWTPVTPRGVTKEQVPKDWQELIKSKIGDEYVIPRYVAAYWFRQSIEEKISDIEKQRDSLNDRVDMAQAKWDAVSTKGKTTVYGQAQWKNLEARKADLISLEKLLADAQTSFNVAGKTLVSSLSTNVFDIDTQPILDKYSADRIKASAAGNYTAPAVSTTPTGTTPTGTTPTGTTPTGTTPTGTMGEAVNYFNSLSPADQAKVEAAKVRTGDVLSAVNAVFPNWKTTPVAAPIPDQVGDPGVLTEDLLPGGYLASDLTDEQKAKIAAEATAAKAAAAQDAATKAAAAQVDGANLGATTGSPFLLSQKDLGGGMTAEDYIAEMEGLGAPFEPGAIRQLGYQQQTPFTAWTRLGLQGALTPEGTPTTDLSTFAQGALQDYFGRTVEPGYAAALAQASQQRAAGGTPEFQTGFERFAREAPGQFGLGRVSPDQLQQQQQQLIETLQGTTRMEDPYREELLSYLGDIEDPTNIRLMGALGRPTLGQISPIYRAAAQKRMQARLQNLMAMQPERQLVSFFGGDPGRIKQSWLTEESPFARYAQPDVSRTIP